MAFIGKFAAALALIALFIAGGFWALGHFVGSKFASPDPQTIASVSLAGLREQNRLSAFAVQLVSVTTSTQSQFGLSSKKTLIMPGMVRYEVDLAKLGDDDVHWNANTKTLDVVLPPIELDGPQIDLNQIREYGEGGLLSTFTNADAKLTAANRKAGQTSLIEQARGPQWMKPAKDATRRAVEANFATPLKAAGIDAKVRVHFADEAKADGERWDVSRSVQDVLSNTY